MPEIKQFTRQNLPRQLIQGRGASASDFVNTAGLQAQSLASSELSGALSRLETSVREIQVKKDRIGYLENRSKLQRRLQEEKLRLKTEDIGDDVIGFYQQRFDEISEEFGANVPSSMQERWVEDKASFGTNFFNSGVADFTAREASKRKLALGNIFDAEMMNIQDNPSSGQIQTSLRTYEEALSTFKISPEERALMLDKFSDELVSQKNSTIKRMRTEAFESDPLGAFSELQSNPENFTSEEAKKITKLASKFNERLEAQEMAQSFAANSSNLSWLYGQAPDKGKMTLSDLEQIEDRTGVTPFTKLARKELTVPESKLPKPSASEQALAFSELNQKFINIQALSGGKGKDFKLSPGVHKMFLEFQDEVLDKAERNLISPAEAQRFINRYNSDRLLAIQAGEDIEVEGEGFFGRGVGNPYSEEILPKIERYLESKNQSNNHLLRKEMVDVADQFLGDYKSSGNTKKDRETLDGVFKDTVEYLFNRSNPSAPNGANAVIGGRVEIMEDAKGNVARVKIFPDGRKEIIEVIENGK